MTATADPRAWRPDTIDAPDGWYTPLSSRTLAALDRNLADWRPVAQPVTDLRASENLRAAGATHAGST
jgi:hypothetical protein